MYWASVAKVRYIYLMYLQNDLNDNYGVCERVNASYNRKLSVLSARGIYHFQVNLYYVSNVPGPQMNAPSIL